VLWITGSIVAERKGKCYVGLRVGTDRDVVQYSLSDISIVDRIEDLEKVMECEYCEHLYETYFGFDLPDIDRKVVGVVNADTAMSQGQ
jgi:hypothetical protein